MTNDVKLTRRQVLAAAAVAALPGRLLAQADATATTMPAGAAAGSWSPVPLVSAEIRRKLADRGRPDLGGEGGQWIRSLALGPDGQTAIWGTDVGGLYRSLDAGSTWEPCNVGFTPRGCTSVAFDPSDANRILVVAANSMAMPQHGLYLSIDRGASWRHVLEAKYASAHDFRHQAAFEVGGDRCYWSRVAKDSAGYDEPVDDPAFYRSPDRGETWERLPDSAHLGGGFVACTPGRLFVATPAGLFRSTDGGESFGQLDSREYTGLSASGERLYATTKAAVLRSDDGGQSFDELPSGLADTGFSLRFAQASPADPDRVGLFRQSDEGYDWSRHVSHDGGATWARSEVEDELAFLPQNVRQPRFAWHPTDPDVCLASGGDWPTKSTDGGRTFAWSAAGVNNILVGGLFHFAEDDPDVLFVGSQDYNGGLTRDGGATWGYANPSGESWGGFTYGGYTPDGRVLWVGVAASWGGGRQLTTSRDGGATWREVDGVAWADGPGKQGPYGINTGFSRGNAWFAGPFRSTDAGENWRVMDGCSGVLSTAGGVLVGGHLDDDGKQASLALSTDGGETWRTIPVPGRVQDASYDPAADVALVANEDRLLRVSGATGDSPKIDVLDTPADSLGNRRVTGVCHDPRDRRTVYAAQHKNVYATDVAAMRSTDGGETWTVLTRRDAPLPRDRRDPAQLDGGREAMQVRVHPTTGAAWFSTGCYGVWKWTPRE